MSLPGAAGELVLAEAAIDDVITAEAIDLVVAGIAIDDVGALGAGDLVVALGAGNRVDSIIHADGDGLLEGQAARILDLQFDLMGRRGLEIELRAVSHEQLLAGSIELETAAGAVCQSVGERVVRVRVNRRERADLRAVGSVFGNCGRGKRQDTDVDWGLVDIGQGDGEWSRDDDRRFVCRSRRWQARRC